MKKFTTLLLSCAMAASVVNVKAQVNLYNNDFESYTVGGKIALQAGAPWTTWSNMPGSAEDPVISNTQAHSGTKSIFVANNNDLVFQFADLTTGRYVAEWYMFVETGKLGYFNFLSHFAGSNSKWAFQAFFVRDSIFIDADGSGAYKTLFPFNTWNKIQMIIDLDDDFATLYVNNVEMISYQWSKGATGNDNSLKLDGINFYGWNESGLNSGYYVDDLNIDSVAAPGQAPMNLDAALNGNDIEVSWSPPATPPDSYKLSNNGKVVYTTTGLTYTHVAPWPGMYRYVVRAHYSGLGYSHSSNMDSVYIAGGVTRNLVLMECGTGLWCPHCPYASMGLHDLIQVNNKNAVAIKYQSGDSLEIPACGVRLAYYGITGLPTVVADGRLFAEGTIGTVSQYPRYLEMYNQRINLPSHHNLNVTVVQNTGNNFTATIEIEQTFQAFTSGIKLHTALTESNLPIQWQGQTEVDYALRGMFPNAYGTDLDFSVQNPLTKTINFSIGGHIKNNCQLVVFVQYDALKEVTQVAKVDLASVIGLPEISGERINIYPNPATEYIIAGSSGKGILEITDLTGKTVLTKPITQISEVIDIRSLTNGIYLIKISNGEKTFTEKLIKM